MFAAAGTEPWSSLLLIALTLLLLPVVLVPALVSYVTAATAFRPFGTLAQLDPGRLPAAEHAWLWVMALIGVGWIAWRVKRERLSRMEAGTPVHVNTPARKPAPSKDAMISVFGTPELWSKVGRGWSGRRAKTKERNSTRPVRESRLRRLGIEWNWRRPWTVILSPKVQPQQSSAFMEGAMGDQSVEDRSDLVGDVQGYEVQELETGSDETEVYDRQDGTFESEVAAGDDATATVEQGYSVTDYAIEAYPDADQPAAEQPVQESYTIRVGARGFLSGR